MDLDCFFVSVECLRNPQLKGKPIIIGGHSDRGVVASCSYEARKFGVRSAMPVRMAKQLCPQVQIVSGDMDAYSKYSHLVTNIIEDQAPLYEKSSIDEFYIDLTGMDKFFGIYKWAHELRSKIMRESGLPISMGLSVNKMVSKVATGEAKPNGERKVNKGDERNFLAPMSISKIPMLGEKTYSILCNMGVEKVATLREIPVELLQNLFGKNGTELWRRANAIDDSPVVPYSERKSISTENTLEKDTIDVKMLKSLLTSMVEEIAFKLRQEQKLTACVTVKIRYSNFDTVTRQCHISYTSADHVLLKTASELFDKLYDRRMLIRLIGVRFSHLVYGNYQIRLFEDTEHLVGLYQAMDKIRFKFGSDKIGRAAGIDLNKLVKESENATLTKLKYSKA
jgi:DNA polymerase-4